MHTNKEVQRRTILRYLLGLPLVATPVMLGACSSATSEQELVIASGEEGGMYFEFARLLSTAIVDSGVAEQTQVLKTQATAQNLQLLADGKAHLALGLADTVSQFNSEKVPEQQLMALGRIYQNYFHCIVNADSRINTLAGLADKRIGTGAPGSGTWVTGQRILSASGLKEVSKAPVEIKLGYSAGIHALRQGTIDALFLFGGMPVTSLAKLASERRLRLLDVSVVLPKLREEYPALYDQVLIPKNTYPNISDVNTIGVSNLLMTRPDLPNKTASAIVKMLATRSATLIPSGSAGIQNLTPETLISTAGQQLHPGAREAYEQLHG